MPIGRKPGERLQMAAYVAAVPLVLGVMYWNLRPSDNSAAVWLSQGQDWLARGDYDEALACAEKILLRSPTDSAGLLLAGEASAKSGQHRSAAEYFDRVDPAAAGYPAALVLAGDAWLQLDHCREAEARYRLALRQEHGSAEAEVGLVHLCGILGRTAERREYLHALLQRGEVAQEDLVALASPDLQMGPLARVQRLNQAAPNDPIVLTALGILEHRARRLPAAEATLRAALKLDPGYVEAQVHLGFVLLEKQDDLAWLEWREQCSAEVRRHPLAWAVEGIWLHEHGHAPQATSCYLESLSLQADGPGLHMRVATTLAQEGAHELAAAFEERAGRLVKVQQAAEIIARRLVDQQPQSIIILAEKLEELGRLREAVAWRTIQMQDRGHAAAARDAIDRIRGEQAPDGMGALIKSAKNRVTAVGRPALPDWSDIRRAHAAPSPPRQLPLVQFADVAATSGIAFRYFTGFRADLGGSYLRETLGGGVAALDYDGDGWCDAYFTQGCQWPPDPRQQTWLDRCYRNLSDGRFADVTALAGLGDNQYSGGVATGDWDSDGWPDIYVANIGVNGLYSNNGDGTFDHVTVQSGMDGTTWTASCLVADLNGDALPDLFDVTYVGGDAQERLCKPASCAPKIFPALQDRLWLNVGDGRFAECGEAAGIHAEHGVGLGIVAADFRGEGKLDLFVANDQTPNFFLVNHSQPSGGLLFSERGIASGLAVDGWGRPQASMGVACGDADGDGALDLFVTNFENESNTYYQNLGQGELFLDVTARAGLADPSFAMLGFGTQFLDGDLDGWLDLIVTNGNVDIAAPQRGSRLHMRPQYFHNLGLGQFVEMTADTLGPFFAGEYLGRGLTRLDWNRDGREDVVISHCDAPAALLTNTSSQTGHFLAIQVRGVQSARDAIGTTVQIVAGERRRTAQLTAGDGYMASNQRQLVFGLGACDVASEMTVRWPSGLRQSFADVAADKEYLLVEGAKELLILP